MTVPLSPNTIAVRARRARRGLSSVCVRLALVVVLALAVSAGAVVDPVAASNPGSARAQAGASANWPQWRGPLGTGVAPIGGAPLRFGADEGVKWRTVIPGRGFSSPVVWDELVFITTAVPRAAELTSGDRPRRRRRRRVPHDFRLVAIRRDDGDVAWSRDAVTAIPHEGYHREESSYANSSPFTDGELVYAFFGSRGLYAYDLDGKLRWSRDFGVEMEMLGQFGEASTPALHGDTIVVVFDHQGQSFIEAVDAADGETRWRALRDEDTSWSSPYVVEHEGRAMVVASGGNFITAYDLGDGEVVWRSRGMTQHPIPTPVAGGGLLFAASGSTERRVRAIALGGKGDLSDTDAIVWQLDKAAPYSPSPLLVNDELYLVRDGGMTAGTSRLSLIDARTGDAHYLERQLPGGYTIKASPVSAGDRLYLATQEGDVLVLQRGPHFEVLATNAMDDVFVASPAIAYGEMFLRGREHLICIAAQ